ncbi:MAG: DUF4230 domain-containing protein [Anaeromyxobacteraceae bacterium]
MRSLVKALVLGLAVGAGAVVAARLVPPRGPSLPDAPAIATQVREVARLEALDVALYKKVTFAPEPSEGGVWAWASYTFRAPRGRAIVFADAHLGLDLARLDAAAVRVLGRDVAIVLPPLEVRVELRPGETEVIGSNLDTAETAKLFELARTSFEREVAADARLRERARRAAERAIRALLTQAGFRSVTFDGPVG